MTDSIATTVPTLTMNTGASIPQVGFGVWQIEDSGAEVIEQAIEAGYRHLDTAMNPEHQQRAASDFGKSHGVLTEDYSPLANGRVLDDARIRTIAQAHGKTVPQVILRWHVQLGNIVIPKTKTKARMEENLDIFDFDLSAEEMSTVSSFDGGQRVGNDPHTVNGA